MKGPGGKTELSALERVDGNQLGGELGVAQARGKQEFQGSALSLLAWCPESLHIKGCGPDEEELLKLELVDPLSKKRPFP